MSNDELFAQIKKLADEMREKQASACPSCGHCPTCGHTPWRAAPLYPWYPTYPIYPSGPYWRVTPTWTNATGYATGISTRTFTAYTLGAGGGTCSA